MHKPPRVKTALELLEERGKTTPLHFGQLVPGKIIVVCRGEERERLCIGMVQVVSVDATTRTFSYRPYRQHFKGDGAGKFELARAEDTVTNYRVQNYTILDATRLKPYTFEVKEHPSAIAKAGAAVLEAVDVDTG